MLSIFLFLIFGSIGTNFANIYDLVERYGQELRTYQETKQIPLYHSDTLEQLLLARKAEDLKDQSFCDLCYFGANFLIAEFRLNVSIDVITFEFTALCTLLNIEAENVCEGVVDRNINIVDYIIRADPNLQGERMCDLVFQKNGCNKTSFEWTVDIPDGETVPRKPQSNPEQTFTILQISDIHYDPLYTEGESKDCKEPFCCHNEQNVSEIKDGTSCGYWGEYQKADSSEALAEESIRKASEFTFDYVYFTGDGLSHLIWKTSIEENTKQLKTLFGKMKSSFKNVPIYPVLGNHEPTPFDEYAIGENLDPSISTEWLYQLISNEFSEWLPNEAKETLMLGGFYTVSPREGFRIVVINSNVAQTMNWWLIHDDVDPFDQLDWLAKTLKKAEDNDEVVHILSHIPSGTTDLLKVWSREYHKIIERFANTIGAQFNGHTHHDQFVAYYSDKNISEVVSVALNGASVMPDRSNPSFKLLHIDNSNYDVIDTDEWTFNLTEANLNGNLTPNWYKLYSFREHYGVQSLAPSVFTEFLPKVAATHSLLDDYHIFTFRNSDIVQKSPCNDGCKKNYLCEMAISQNGDRTQCQILQEIYDNH